MKYEISVRNKPKCYSFLSEREKIIINVKFDIEELSIRIFIREEIAVIRNEREIYEKFRRNRQEKCKIKNFFS